MGYISYKRFQKLVEKHERYLKENTDNWRSCKAVVVGETIGEMIVKDAYLSFSFFENTTFKGTTFIDTNFRNADFHDCEFHDCNFIGCDFGNANFVHDRFNHCRFTSSTLNFCIFDGCSITDSRTMSDDILKILGLSEGINIANISIIGSVFNNCNFTFAFAEKILFKNNTVNSCRFYGCDFSLVDIYRDQRYGDRRSVFSNCDFHDDENKNIPDLPMACPRVGSFIAYKKVYAGHKWCDCVNIGPTAIVVLQVPASAKRLSANSKKCRCDKAKILRFETLGGEKIKDPENYHFKSIYNASFEYVVGETITPEFAFNTDRWQECASGIHFFMNREDAVFY